MNPPNDFNDLRRTRGVETIAQKVARRLDQEAQQRQRGAHQDRLADRALRGEYGNGHPIPDVHQVDLRGNLGGGGSSYDDALREEEREHERENRRQILKNMAASEGARVIGGGPRPMFADPDRDALQRTEGLRALRALALLAARQRAARKGRAVTPSDVNKAADSVVKKAAKTDPAVLAALRGYAKSSGPRTAANGRVAKSSPSGAQVARLAAVLAANPELSRQAITRWVEGGFKDR